MIDKLIVVSHQTSVLDRREQFDGRRRRYRFPAIVFAASNMCPYLLGFNVKGATLALRFDTH